jgi:hypothetical protein
MPGTGIAEIYFKYRINNQERFQAEALLLFFTKLPHYKVASAYMIKADSCHLILSQGFNIVVLIYDYKGNGAL